MCTPPDKDEGATNVSLPSPSTLFAWIKDYSGALSLVFGASGALAYVALSVACTAVYAPLGISPSDVGLDYGALLARAGTLVAAFAVLGAMGVAFVLMVMWLVNGSVVLAVAAFIAMPVLWAAICGDWPPPLGAVLLPWFVAALYVWTRGGRRDPRGILRPRKTALWAGVSALALFLVVLFASAAEEDARRLKVGRKPVTSVLGVSVPWKAEIVHISWAQEPTQNPPQLPTCLVYLGQADGMSVFYDPSRHHQRSLRLPTRLVLIEVLPNTHSARPRPGHFGPCS